MWQEIGSEFHLNNSSAKFIKNKAHIDFSIYGDYTFLRSGREAISLVVSQIKPITRLAILPAYICESMLIPFLQQGYDVEFFSIDKEFNPNIEELYRLLERKPDVLLVIDWFGMNKNQEVVTIVKEISPNTKILADCTHSFFNSLQHFESDYIVVSLRKWFALPDGALAISYKSIFSKKAEYVNNNFTNLRKEAMLLKNEYINTKNLDLKNKYRNLLFRAEKEISNSKGIVGISPYSLSLINSMDFGDMKRKRRENFNTLYELINKYPTVSIISQYITEHQCPFFFPILAEGYRNDLQGWLASRSIYCQVLWPLPTMVYDKFHISAYISDNILCIPCDQRYSREDMNYICEILKNYFEESYNESEKDNDSRGKSTANSGYYES